MSDIAQTNLEEGQKFLEENGKNEDVTVLDSGLQFKVIKEGGGKTPGFTDSVTVHYKGSLLDGTVFDSSYDRGEPATFPVGHVIEGWVEALQLMKEGEIRELYIPPKIGYGESGAGGDIGPNATLIFQVELLKVR
ncbi:MAG: FKBP-type peptidyl-prolyl cis-trans isomerase [Planctomycetota bacterium]